MSTVGIAEPGAAAGGVSEFAALGAGFAAGVAGFSGFLICGPANKIQESGLSQATKAGCLSPVKPRHWPCATDRNL
jgi:hypothetical protein